MDDKRFKEKMGKYVRSTANERSEDMKKYLAPEKKSVHNFLWLRIALVSISLVIVIVGTMSIVLISSPRQMLDNTSDLYSAYSSLNSAFSKEDSSEITYYDSYDVELIKIETLKECNQIVPLNYLKPKEDFLPLELHVFKAKDNDIYLGVKFDYQGIDFDYNSLTFSAALNKYNNQFIKGYEVCTESSTWHSIELKFDKLYSNDDEIYTIKIIFTSGDYDYFMTVTVYEDFTPQEILDFLF